MTESASKPDATEMYDPFLWANLNRWAARAYWTTDEAAALSLCKDPRSLNLARIENEMASPYAIEFLDRMDTIRRAAEVGQIGWKCPPNQVIEWFDQYGMPYAEMLKSEVEKFYPVTHWRNAFFGLLAYSNGERERSEARLAQYEAALNSANEDSASYESWRDEALQFMRDLAQDNEEMRRRLDEMVAEQEQRAPFDPPAANDNCDEVLSPKERTSKDCMIAAMAIYGYGFDPAAKSSPIPGEIAGEIANLRYSLTPETISGHIRTSFKRLGITERPADD